MLSAEHISQAEKFINRHGTVLHRARAAALLHATPPPPEALALWKKGWQNDGGWASAGAADLPPGKTSGRSTLIATIRALRYAHELGLGVIPEVRGALFWLTRQQQPAGSFVDERPIVSDVLDKQRLGVPDNRMDVWATATVLHMLDEWVSAVQPLGAARQQAYEWLLRCVDAWNTQYPRSVWLMAAALRWEGAASVTALQLTAQLTLRLSSEEAKFTARDLADLATTLLEAGWPLSESPVSCALTQLARTRRDDGAFADPLGREDVMESTVAAIRAYTASGRASSSPAFRR